MRKYIFSDEAGNFDFSRSSGASRYYIICTICLDDCSIGNEILELRRSLVWDGHHTKDQLHAAYDPAPVRNKVYEIIEKYDFRIDATILEKSKAQPQTKISNFTFYKYAWYYHLRSVAPFISGNSFLEEEINEIFISPASIGTSNEKAIYKSCVDDVARQSVRRSAWKSCFWETKADPCLQVADYCTWAIQRRWEKGKNDDYNRIANKISREFDLWAHGDTHYY